MLRMWLNLLKSLLLLLTICSTIVCLNCEQIAARRKRNSTPYDTSSDLSAFISADLSNFIKKNNNTHQRKKQQIHTLEPNASTNEADIDKKIKEIFTIYDSERIERFNVSDGNAEFESAPRMYGDAPIIHAGPPVEGDSNLKRQLPFIVRRNSDGKLNIVYNTTLSLQRLPHQQPAKKPNPDRIIVYPSPPPIVHKPIQCEDNNGEKTFCTKVVNYPELSSLKDELNKYASYFGEDLPPIEFAQRMDNEGSYLCNSVEKIIYPEAGETRNASLRFIVNDGLFKQGIRIEECANPNSECKFMDSLPNNYVATCKQHFVYRRLVAITEDKAIVKDEFKMPSCCKCVVRVR